MDENTKKMLSGQPYIPDTDELNHLSSRGHQLCQDYNQLYDTLIKGTLLSTNC